MLEHAVFCQFSGFFSEIKKITFRVLYTLNLNCLEGHEVFFYSICYMITTTLKQRSLLDLIYIFTRAYWYWYISLSSTISRSFFYIVAFSLIIHARRGDVSLSSLSNYRIQGDWLRLPSFGLFTEIGVVLPLVLALLEAAASLVVLLLLGRGGGVRC